MIDLGPHWVFIVSGYAGVAVVVAALIGWTLVNARRARARLAELDRRP
jgi:heme exporter protein CcmD